MCAVLLLVAAGVRADPPADPARPPDPAGPVFTDRPTVLLLDTFRIVEGEFTRTPGGDYAVTRAGVTTTHPAAKVLFAGYSRTGVSEFLAARAAAQSPAPATATVGLNDYNSLALKAFPSRVQPVLSNLCASCHAKPDYPGRFKLTPVSLGHADPAGSAQNLRVVLGAIDRADPSTSDLLTKLVTKHGAQRQPSLLVRTHPALARMELWAHWATTADGTPELLSVPRKAPVIVSPPTTPTVARPGPTLPAPAAPAGDPHDPGAFNRAAHPGRR